MSYTSKLDEADRNMRQWTFAENAKIANGSEAQKQMFCEMLLQTHNPYKPAVIDWPPLDPEALRRVTSLPIWDIAVQTEGRASVAVASYAATVHDPLLNRALKMNADEEARHKVVLSKLVEAYGITLAPEPDYPPPKNRTRGWIKIGYSECIDSFFAFGLFESAKRTGFFPEALVETFEPVIQEEARHILFFRNWLAWYRHSLRWWQRPLFEAQVVSVWVQLIYERIGMARGIDADGAAKDMNFPANAADAVGGIDAKALITLCLTENSRRMAGYDRRLKRPTFVPHLAAFALRFMK